MRKYLKLSGLEEFLSNSGIKANYLFSATKSGVNIYKIEYKI